LCLCLIAASRATLALLAAKDFELRCGRYIGAGGKMKSIAKREIAILVVMFMAVPIA